MHYARVFPSRYPSLQHTFQSVSIVLIVSLHTGTRVIELYSIAARGRLSPHTVITTTSHETSFQKLSLPLESSNNDNTTVVIIL